MIFLRDAEERRFLFQFHDPCSKVTLTDIICTTFWQQDNQSIKQKVFFAVLLPLHYCEFYFRVSINWATNEPFICPFHRSK